MDTWGLCIGTEAHSWYLDPRRLRVRDDILCKQSQKATYKDKLAVEESFTLEMWATSGETDKELIAAVCEP